METEKFWSFSSALLTVGVITIDSNMKGKMKP